MKTNPGILHSLQLIAFASNYIVISFELNCYQIYE